MGGNRTVHAGGGRSRAAAHDDPACRGGCAVLYRADRLPVADAAEGFSALHDGATLLLSLARLWLVADHQPRARHAGARKRSTGGTIMTIVLFMTPCEPACDE